MSEDLNVFPNAKSPLFGAGEDSIGIIQTAATAKLTGDITQAKSTSNNTTVKRTGTTFGVTAVVKVLATSAGTNEASVSITTPTDSLVVIAYSCELGVGGSGTFNMRILDGTDELQIKSESFTQTKYQLMQDLFVGTPKSGPRIYNIQVFGPSSNGLLEVSIFVSHVQFDDTHGGAIDTVAIATKQINSPDSHTTREIAVLPG